ncbi:hypothetical protein FACS1894169_12980 [Bacteroidia bacterium]|nr:hypothetical protein FACS1894169_12980 [Bacteroidia bacterium]
MGALHQILHYYTYSASGVKLKTEQRYDPTLQLSPVQTTTPATDGFTDYKNTDYVGNIIYETEKKGTAVTNKTRILVDGGYIEGYHYYLNDHLGNNRMTVNQNGVKTQWNHYYPFGTAFADKYDNGTNQPYKYNGKELDQMHGLNLYDYSARYYESAIGRFTTVDPLAEKYYSISPYAYCANNPLRYVDLKGDSLTYHGDRDAAINMHNTHLGGYYTTSIDENGLVSMSAVSGMDLSKMTPEQKAYADVLDAVVNGTDGMTTIDIVENSSDVLIGDLQLSAIDVGDISKLPQSGLLPSNGMGAMIHEVKEQYNVQVVNRGDKSSNLKNWKAHMGGSNTESKVVGAGINPDRPTTTFPSGSKDGYIDVSSNKGNARIHFRNYNVTGVSYFK